VASEDFDKQFDDMVHEFKLVEPLSISDILEGLRNVVEANLYVNDYLAEFFSTMQSSVEDVAEEEEVPDEIFLEMPAFSHKATVYLTLLFDAAKSFCEIVTEEVEEG
jgi:hypothetical protein